MNRRYPLETQYLHAHELYDELWQVLSMPWEEDHRVGRGKSTTNKRLTGSTLKALKGKINGEFETLHSAYEAYHKTKKAMAFWQEALSYVPLRGSELKEERSYLKEALHYFHQQQKANYKTLCDKTGIHLGANAALWAFIHNDYEHTAYHRQRSRNGSKQHMQYDDYYRSHVYLADSYCRFYLTKGNYFYLGLFFFGGLLFTSLAFAAMLGWPPAVWIMLGSNVGVIALKITLVLGSIPIFYLTNGFIQLKNQYKAQKKGETDYAKGDWHLSHALTLDIIVAILTLFAVIIPLFYIMTVPHGMMLALWIMAGLTTLSTSQAALAYLDGKRRVGYLGSGLLGSAGQKQEALNRKLSLRHIVALSLEHRRHPIKYLLNPFAWPTSVVDVMQQLILRCCEVGTTAGSRSSLFRFKLKQDVDLFIDFVVSPLRLAAVLWAMVLSACDFTSAPYIPLWGENITIQFRQKKKRASNASPMACKGLLKGEPLKAAVSGVSGAKKGQKPIDKPYFRWQPVDKIMNNSKISPAASPTLKQ